MKTILLPVQKNQKNVREQKDKFEKSEIRGKLKNWRGNKSQPEKNWKKAKLSFYWHFWITLGKENTVLKMQNGVEPTCGSIRKKSAMKRFQFEIAAD